MLHITKLHLTMLNKQWKAGRKWEPAAAAREHLLVGIKIVIPVLPYVGPYTSDDGWSCVNDDYFDLPIFANCNFQSEKSPTSDFKPSGAWTAELYNSC